MDLVFLKANPRNREGLDVAFLQIRVHQGCRFYSMEIVLNFNVEVQVHDFHEQATSAEENWVLPFVGIFDVGVISVGVEIV